MRAGWSHHITLENLLIHDFDGNQQQVGISTKAPAWHWIVRGNRIERVGTGMYFGNSAGDHHFVHGLIEFNLVRDAVGYAAQIKHRFAASRPSGTEFATMPTTGRTVIHHNVWHKGPNSSSGAFARPNMLLGAAPESGDNADDDVLALGNFFHRNPTGFEALLQAEGHIAVVANLLHNPDGPALFVQPQNGSVRPARASRRKRPASGS